jgi:hypothetical protein
MKEHAFFLEASLPSKNTDLIREARSFNTRYNSLLKEALQYANGVIPMSNDAVTEFTFNIEEKTEQLTGIPIDKEVTTMEMNFPIVRKNQKQNEVDLTDFNNRVINLTENFVRYKTKILNGVLNCSLFTSNYPELIIHIRSEALEYIRLIKNQGPNQTVDKSVDQEIFWNHLMGEHAEFIRGLLDPTEEDLMKIANDFAIDYKNLNKQISSNLSNEEEATSSSIDLTEKITDLKTQGTKGLLNCEIRSAAIPLLGDHVLREANHYRHLLESFQNKTTN